MTKEKAGTLAAVARAVSKCDANIPAFREAVRILVNLRGFSKAREQAEEFFADCFTWFIDKEERFAGLPDAAVAFEVVDRFLVYLNDKLKAEDKALGHTPERDYYAAVDKTKKRAEGVQVSHFRVTKTTSISYTDLIRPSQAEQAHKKKRDKELAKILKQLDSRKYYSWLKEYFVRRLQEKVERQHDPELEQEYKRQASDAINKVLSGLIKK